VMRLNQDSRLVFAIVVLSAVLQIILAGRSGLWPDEVFSLAMATGHSLEHPAAAADPAKGDFVEGDHPVPADEFRRYLKHNDPPSGPGHVTRAVLLSDTSPPLYYLLLYAWTLILGTSDITLRLFSIVCSLACLPLLFNVARRTGGREAAFACCVLYAFSPLALYYSTEGRMYSLLWLCVLATMWASLVLQERGGGIAMYGFWIVASSAGFLTHYFFVFPWVAIVAYLLIAPGSLARVHLAACVLLIAVLILPWYINLPASLEGWRITKDWLKWQPRGFDRLTASGNLMLQFFYWHNKVWLQRAIFEVSALILFALILVAMAWRLRFHIFDGRRRLLWLVFAAACAGPLVFDLVQHTYTIDVPRYAITALPSAYLLAAVGLACMNLRLRVIVVGLIVVTWMPNILCIYSSRLPSLPMREIAWAASAHSRPSDLILVHSIPSGVLGVARYATGPAPLAAWIGQLGNRRVPDSVRALATGRTQIVFVEVHGVREPAPEERWLRANALVRSETRLGSGRIVDFQPVNSKTF
jgi:Dolichyl-phosphate-mannose-protein mannosyltransferase